MSGRSSKAMRRAAREQAKIMQERGNVSSVGDSLAQAIYRRMKKIKRG